MFPCKKEEKKMKNWKHITFEQRKVISSGISHEYKLREIGENLQIDPTSVSKEVKRNRIEISIGLKNNCKRTQRCLMFVQVVKIDIITVLILNINMMLLRHKKKQILI